MNRLFAFALFLAPISAYSGHWSPFEGRFFCQDINNSQKCARYLEKRLNLPFIKRISETRLVIKLKNGKEMIFDDKKSDRHALESYSVVEHIFKYHYLVISKQYYEGGEFSLLNITTGNYYKIGGYPLFSENGKYIVVANYDIDAGYSPNILKIIRVEKSKVVTEYDAKPGDWGPTYAKWIDPITIEYEIGTFECRHLKKSKCKTKRIRRIENEWREIVN